MLNKKQNICIKKGDDNWNNVQLGELMLDDSHLNDFDFGTKFIDLYLIDNKLRGVDRGEHDPRPGHGFRLSYGDPTPNGVKRVLKVGAP